MTRNENADRIFRSRVVYLIAVPCLCVLLGCHGAMQQADMAPPQAVQADPVVKSALQSQVLTATFEPYAQVQLSFQSGGPVDWIRQTGTGSGEHVLSPGDFVGRGEPLAHVRPLDYEQKLAQARAALASAQAVQHSSEATKVQATQDLARSKALFGSEALTRPEMDRSQTNFDSANAAVSQARAGAASAQSQLAQSLTALGDTRLRAPFNGTVAGRMVELGMLMAPGQPAFTFLDTSRVKAIFSVGASSVAAVHVGQRLGVSVQGFPESVSGVVTSVSPAADAKTRVFNVEVTVANLHQLIRPGMTGTVQLDSNHKEGTELTVSLAALVKAPAGQGDFAVYVLTGGTPDATVHLVPVSLGEMRGNSVAVQGGLMEGQRVVTSGATLLRDGQQVRVTP